MKHLFPALLLLMVLTGCRRDTWTLTEKDIIESASPVSRVLTVDNVEDSMMLRQKSALLTKEDIRSDLYRKLAATLVATVTSPEQDGVGIAGPQIGIVRRIIAVQRFDKKDSPFEVYPNILITATRGETEAGPEGCLSVPGRTGDVMLYRDIDITYTSPTTLRDTTERVTGFTAVIFQHETDHLDGILYTDKLKQ